MRVSPCAFAHVEAECTPVARMSEATSGIPFRLYPHVAPLMRATVWGSRSSPYNALRHCLRQTRSVCAGSKATKQSSFVVEAGLLRCARNDGGLSAPARDVGAKQSFVASTGHTTSEGATQSSMPHEEVVSAQPHTRGKCGERRNIIRSDDGRASGSRSLIPDETQSGLRRARSGSSDPPQQPRRRDIIGIHMKKIILATVLAALGSTSALAADLGARAPYAKAPAMVEAVGNWSGFYIGGTVGAAWTADKIRLNAEATPYFASLPGGSDAPAFGALGSPNIKQANVIFGGKAGYNWQASSWVLGLEGDLSSLRFRRAVTITGNPHAGFAN